MAGKLSAKIGKILRDFAKRREWARAWPNLADYFRSRRWRTAGKSLALLPAIFPCEAGLESLNPNSASRWPGIRRGDPFRGGNLVAMCGSAAVFGTFLEIQPLNLGIFWLVRRSRTRRSQRCTRDLWGKPGGSENSGTDPLHDSPHGTHQGWCAGRLCSSSGSLAALPGVPRAPRRPPGQPHDS